MYILYLPSIYKERYEYKIFQAKVSLFKYWISLLK